MGRPGDRFSIVSRPQYHPKCTPIEYNICELTATVSNLKSAKWNMAQLEQELRSSAHQIGSFNSTFWRCGYKWTLDANVNVFYQQ